MILESLDLILEGVSLTDATRGLVEGNITLAYYCGLAEGREELERGLQKLVREN